MDKDAILPYFRPYMDWVEGHLDEASIAREYDHARSVRYLVEMQWPGSPIRCFRLLAHEGARDAAEGGFSISCKPGLFLPMEAGCFATDPGGAADGPDWAEREVRLDFDCLEGPDGPAFQPLCSHSTCDFSVCPFALAAYRVLSRADRGYMDIARLRVGTCPKPEDLAGR